MKETGLMFKAPLVHAILSGQKTQTRRVVKGVGHDNCLFVRKPSKTKTGLTTHVMDAAKLGLCPIGKPGDRVYVRETWQHANFPLGPYQEGAPVFYRVDYLHESDPDYVDAERTIRRNWLPSIHMPKQAARIWLEITGVRVERLQQVSRGDAMAEGCPFPNMADGKDPREWFAEVWQSTGGDWAANPWVWVIDFKTISTTGRPA